MFCGQIQNDAIKRMDWFEQMSRPHTMEEREFRRFESPVGVFISQFDHLHNCCQSVFEICSKKSEIKRVNSQTPPAYTAQNERFQIMKFLDHTIE
jgi:hypothetical protein